MPESEQFYTTFEPGQLITAEAMNGMQGKIRKNIGEQIEKAIDALTEIEKAGDSDKLGGQTAEELLKRLAEQVAQELAKRTGYRQLFKVLKFQTRDVIEHKLGQCPLVDLYELLPFEVVCAHDDDHHAETVRFYLYHTTEKRIRRPGGGTPINIESAAEQPPFRISLPVLLDLYKVEYSDSSSLGDLETELWSAMFKDPNDDFDPGDYCHSPWFEKCCREERTVRSLKEKGDWDELWLKVVPTKVLNTLAAVNEPPGKPRGVQVQHHDLNTLSLMLAYDVKEAGNSVPLRLMILLKV